MIQWLTGALIMFLLVLISLGAIWFGLTENLLNSGLILGGFVGLFVAFKIINRFDWK